MVFAAHPFRQRSFRWIVRERLSKSNGLKSVLVPSGLNLCTGNGVGCFSANSDCHRSTRHDHHSRFTHFRSHSTSTDRYAGGGGGQPYHSSHWDNRENRILFNQYVSHGQLIGRIQTVQDLERAVVELEHKPLFRADHDTIVKPLLGACQVLMNKNPSRVADLAERILLNCLSRLPLHNTNTDAECRNANHLLLLDIDDYNTICLIQGSLRTTEGAKRAESLVQLMTEDEKRGARTVVSPPPPNMTTYKYLSRAWAFANTWEGVVRAETIVLEIMENRPPSHSLGIAPVPPQTDRACYNTLLSAYAKLASTEAQSLERAKRLFERMKASPHIGLEWSSVYFMLQCYRTVLLADETCINEETMTELESLIQEFRRHINTSDQFVDLFVQEGHSYRSWSLKILVDAGRRLVDNESVAQEAKDQWLQRIHNAVCSMVEETKNAVPLESQTYPVHRNHDIFISLYNAWHHNSSVSAADKEARLKHLTDSALTTPYDETRQCNTNLKKWLSSGISNAPVIMQSILDNLDQGQSILPDHQTFHLVMDAWRNSNHDDAPRWNEQNLQQMETRNYRINAKHLRLVLESWLRHCAGGERHEGQHGHLLAAEHVSAYLEEKPAWDQWNVSVAKIAIEAWAQQAVPPDTDELFCLNKTVAMLRETDHRLSRKKYPAEDCYSVLKSCVRVFQEAKSPESWQHAYGIALDLYHDGKRNWKTYTVMAWICNATRVVDESAASPAFMESLFCEAKNCALVTQELVWEVAMAGTPVLRRVFLLSEAEASHVVELQKSPGHDWKRDPAASRLLLKNLPSTWNKSLPDGAGSILDTLLRS